MGIRRVIRRPGAVPGSSRPCGVIVGSALRQRQAANLDLHFRVKRLLSAFRRGPRFARSKPADDVLWRLPVPPNFVEVSGQP